MQEASGATCQRLDRAENLRLVFLDENMFQEEDNNCKYNMLLLDNAYSKQPIEKDKIMPTFAEKNF